MISNTTFTNNQECFAINIGGINVLLYITNGPNIFCYDSYISKTNSFDLILNYNDIEFGAKKSYINNSVNHLKNEQTVVLINNKLICQEIINDQLVNRIPFLNALIIHGSVVAINNQAYMFTAPSGVGKSTRTRLWLEAFPGSIVVNGDKPLIKFTDTDVLACGTPWCGKEGWNTNTMVPLRAIFLLERAEEDSIEEISLGKAFPTLLQQTHRPADQDAMRKTISLLKSLEGRVRLFRYRSTPTIESVKMAYEAVNGVK